MMFYSMPQQECVALQRDLAAVSYQSDHWQLALNPESLAITNKHSPITFTYTIGQTSVYWSNLVRYLGVSVNTKVNWSDHCRIIAAKVTGTLNCLQRSMLGCSCEAKSIQYFSAGQYHLIIVLH